MLFTPDIKKKIVPRQRHKKGVTSCVPILAKTRQYTRKIKQYRMPLISCYFFVYISGDQKRIVLETEYVNGCVSFNDSPKRISDREMENMRNVVGEKPMENVISIENSGTGKREELISGALTALGVAMVR